MAEKQCKRVRGVLCDVLDLTAQHLGQDTPIGRIASWASGTRVEAWAPAGATEDMGKGGPNETQPGNQLPGGHEYADASLYNVNIHPLTRCGIKAVIWFQGEHNVVLHFSRGEYASVFSSLIRR